MPHYWTKIASASAAEQNDQVYEDEATGTVFVLGQASANATKQEIADKYGTTAGDVTFPLKKKN